MVRGFPAREDPEEAPNTKFGFWTWGSEFDLEWDLETDCDLDKTTDPQRMPI